MIEMFGVGLMVAIFMVIVYIIPIWLLRKWNDEDPK
jgi:hypothetical protein